MPKKPRKPKPEFGLEIPEFSIEPPPILAPLPRPEIQGVPDNQPEIRCPNCHSRFVPQIRGTPVSPSGKCKRQCVHCKRIFTR